MKIFWVFFVLNFFVRCGDATPDGRNPVPTGGGEDGNPAPANYLGPWDGFAYQRQDGTTLKDRGFEAKAEFKDDDTFIITLSETSSASGTYQSLDSTHELYINVNKSNTSLVGDPGKKMKYSWVRSGKELSLTSTISDFKLVRPAGYKEPSDQPNPQTGTTSMNGKWNCQENNDGPSWALEISGESDFNATRYRSGTSTQGMHFSGSVTKDVSDKEALMTIKSADDSGSVGKNFRLIVKDKNQIQIGLLKNGETCSVCVDSKDYFTCVRK